MDAKPLDSLPRTLSGGGEGAFLAALKFVDASDWAHLHSVLLAALRHPEDHETRFWLRATRRLREAYEASPDLSPAAGAGVAWRETVARIIDPDAFAYDLHAKGPRDEKAFVRELRGEAFAKADAILLALTTPDEAAAARLKAVEAEGDEARDRVILAAACLEVAEARAAALEQRLALSAAPPPAGDYEQGARDAIGPIAQFLEDYFAPWGSWKTEWWEDISGDQEFTPVNALHYLQKLVKVSAPPPADSGWRPIETYIGYDAVLVSRPTGREVYRPTTAFMDVTGVWRVYRSKRGMAALPFAPSHWQPLPPPPADHDASEGRGGSSASAESAARGNPYPALPAAPRQAGGDV